MTTHLGNEGSVYFGTDEVGELRSWQITETAQVVDDSAIGDAADTHLVGSTSWRGQFVCAFDPADSDGQASVRAGSQVTLNLYGIGNTTGNKYFSGTATITEIGRQASRNGLIEQTFSFQGTGALAISTAS